VILDPDMVLIKKIPYHQHITGQNVAYMSYDNVTQIQGFNLQRYGITPSKWVPIGCVMQFPNQQEDFFLETHEILLDLLSSNEPLKTTQAYWQREMVAWGIVLSKNNHRVSLYRDYEMPLDPRLPDPTGKRKSHVAHYCNGVYPFFEKRWHNRTYSFSLEIPLPFEKILNIPLHDPIILKFKEIVKSFLNRNSHRINSL
jgi:hypothetical protein